MNTKIIVTIGPATLDYEVFTKLYDVGFDYLRINTSYGDYHQYDQILDHLHRVDPQKKIQVVFDVKEERVLDYFIKNNLDIVAMSFVENGETVSNIKGKIGGKEIWAKIETQSGVKEFDSILSASDGIMVARGDLSKNLGLEKVPPIQKFLTQKTIASEKFLIIATEMLLSMTGKDKPEVAEVSDVANAVFDGASAVMLSEETAVGNYPIEALTYMRKTIEEAEQWLTTKSVV